MFMKKFLAHQGYLAPLAGGNGADISHLEENFDESVLDKEDTSDLDGSKFEGDDESNPNEDPDDAAARRAAKKAAKAEPAPKDKPAKSEEATTQEEEVDPDAPKTLADATKKEDPPAKTGKGVIPTDRHEAILNKVRAERDEAVRALANAQGGAKIVQANTEITALENEVTALTDKYEAAMIDGDREAAKAVGRELRAKERALGDKKTEIAVSIARADAIETTRYDVARERIEEAYTVLQPGHEDYDQAVMDEVIELIGAYQLKNYTPTDALQKAVRVLLGTKGTAQASAATVKPRVDAADVDEKLKSERKANAVDKALKTVQPPSTEKVGLDHDKLGKKTPKDIANLSEKEFDDLTEEELAKYGGDHRLVEENED